MNDDLTPQQAADVEALVTFLLGTDALTPNDDGTPTHYIVNAEDVEYLVRTIVAERDATRDGAESSGEHAAFYAKHYSDPDWTVHELPLIVYVPTTQGRDFALGLVREVLDEAAFDIRISPIRGGA